MNFVQYFVMVYHVIHCGGFTLALDLLIVYFYIIYMTRQRPLC